MFYITTEAVESLDRQSSILGVSRSELVEMLARGTISPEEAKLLGEPLAS